MVHLPLLVGELSCAVARVLIDHIGGLYLQVTCRTGVVEEEVDEGTLESCTIALVDGEARTGDLHTELEVDEVIALGELPVWSCIRREVGHSSPRLDADVVLGCRALGDDLVGEVRDEEEDLTDLGLSLGLTLLEALALALELGDLGTDGLRLLLEALLHQGTDLLSDSVLLR